MWASPQLRPHPRVPVWGGPRRSGVWPLHGVIPPPVPKVLGRLSCPPVPSPPPGGLGCLWCSDESASSGDRDRSAMERLGSLSATSPPRAPHLSGDTQAGRPGVPGHGQWLWAACLAMWCLSPRVSGSSEDPPPPAEGRGSDQGVLPHCPVASWVDGDGEGVTSLQLALHAARGSAGPCGGIGALSRSRAAVGPASSSPPHCL